MKEFVSTSSDAWKLPPVIRYKETKEIVEIEEGEEEEEEGNEDGEGRGEIMDRNVHESSTDTDPAPQEPLSVCAIDCEMCYTKAGLELTRVRGLYSFFYSIFFFYSFSNLRSLFFVLCSLFFFLCSLFDCIYQCFSLSCYALFNDLISLYV